MGYARPESAQRVVRAHPPLHVDDVDAFTARAVAAGATVTMPVADMFWGDRYGRLEDPFGHRWSVATHVRDVTPAQMKEALQTMSRG